MKVEISLYGAFREHEPAARLALDVADVARVAGVREALRVHGETHWPGFKPGLLAKSAFASETAVLRDDEPVPADGRLAVLPPVSGG